MKIKTEVDWGKSITLSTVTQKTNCFSDWEAEFVIKHLEDVIIALNDFIESKK